MRIREYVDGFVDTREAVRIARRDRQREKGMVVDGYKLKDARMRSPRRKKVRR